MLLIKIILLFLHSTAVFAHKNQYHLSVNDILSQDLMPASFLLLGGIEEFNDDVQMRARSDNNVSLNDTQHIEDASMEHAFLTMGYHR
jgi:hypothetical protein